MSMTSTKARSLLFRKWCLTSNRSGWVCQRLMNYWFRFDFWIVWMFLGFDVSFLLYFPYHICHQSPPKDSGSIFWVCFWPRGKNTFFLDQFLNLLVGRFFTAHFSSKDQKGNPPKALAMSKTLPQKCQFFPLQNQARLKIKKVQNSRISVHFQFFFPGGLFFGVLVGGGQFLDFCWKFGGVSFSEEGLIWGAYFGGCYTFYAL